MPSLAPTNPPLLAAESDSLKAMLRDIARTKEAIEGYLRDDGGTAPAVPARRRSTDN